MLRSICYSLMGGCLLTMVAWMAKQNPSADDMRMIAGLDPSARVNFSDKTALEAQTDDLIAWVDRYDLDSQTYRMDWLDHNFMSYIDEMDQSSSGLEIESGMPGRSVRQAIHNAMISLTVPTPKKKHEVEIITPRWVSSSPYISGRGGAASRGTGAGSGANGHRRSLNRLMDKTFSSSQRSRNSFRRPSFLKNMFSRRSRSTRNANRYNPFGRSSGGNRY